MIPSPSSHSKMTESQEKWHIPGNEKGSPYHRMEKRDLLLPSCRFSLKHELTALNDLLWEHWVQHQVEGEAAEAHRVQYFLMLTHSSCWMLSGRKLRMAAGLFKSCTLGLACFSRDLPWVLRMTTEWDWLCLKISPPSTVILFPTTHSLW